MEGQQIKFYKVALKQMAIPLLAEIWTRDIWGDMVSWSFDSLHLEAKPSLFTYIKSLPDIPLVH